MDRGRGRTVIAGILIGAVLGLFFYWVPAYFLVCGSLPKSVIIVPWEIRESLFKTALVFGVIPGAVIGLIGGMGSPIMAPRGFMSKSIGAFTWLIVTILAWITQWKHLSQMSAGRIVTTIFITLASFIMCLGVSGYIGGFIERIRE